MQIHELNTFSGTPSSSNYLAIDTGSETLKLPANTFMTEARTDAKYLTESQADALYILAPEAYAATLPSTFAASTLLVRRYGAVVTITINNVTKAATGSNVLFTLPAGWRPPGLSQLLLIPPAASIAAGQTNLSLRLVVNASGEVSVYNYRSSAINGNTNAGGILTYIATQ